MRRTISGSCFIESNFHPADNNSGIAMNADDICNLFGSLSLKGGVPDSFPSQTHTFVQPTHTQPPVGQTSNTGDDEDMMEVRDSQGNVQFISNEERPGCALIHALQDHFRFPSSVSLSPTPSYPPKPYPASAETPNPSFSFLDTILTHREAFVAFPYGHRGCSSALTALAFHLEHRARDLGVVCDGDVDTAIALHNEAWLMAGWR